jgi:hypothetical protein
MRREIPDPGARGLYVVVQPSGVKSFAVRYRHAGKPRKLTLAAGISLAAARKAAAGALYELEQGHDPRVAKRAAKAKALVGATYPSGDELLRRPRTTRLPPSFPLYAVGTGSRAWVVSVTLP